MGVVLSSVRKFKRKYPGCVAWRLRKNSEVVEMHLNPDEMVLFAFAGQKNDSFWDFFSTAIICLTNHRILIGRKHVLYGYSVTSITPDMFNDLDVYQGLIWGKIVIDTIKEVVTITDLDKHCLPEIETNISQFMMKEKKKYLGMSRDDD